MDFLVTMCPTSFYNQRKFILTLLPLFYFFHVASVFYQLDIPPQQYLSRPLALALIFYFVCLLFQFFNLLAETFMHQAQYHTVMRFGKPVMVIAYVMLCVSFVYYLVYTYIA